jgi:hypothetical protein
MSDSEPKPLATLMAEAVANDLIGQAEKVRDGWIRDPDLVRPILKQLQALDNAFYRLADAAEEAFVEGWESTDS